MCKLKMFDIEDENIRENQKKFIEVLLIIGGIIGGIQIKETALMNPDWSIIIYSAWGCFLIGSLLYYHAVSFSQKDFFFFLEVILSIFLVSFGFTIIVLLPFINTKISNEIILIIGLLIFILINLALYQGREEKK